MTAAERFAEAVAQYRATINGGPPQHVSAAPTTPSPQSPDEQLAAQIGARTLTARERQVARLVAEGLTDKEIAAKLGTGVRTVNTQVTSIRAKLGLRSRVDLATWVVSNW